MNHIEKYNKELASSNKRIAKQRRNFYIIVTLASFMSVLMGVISFFAYQDVNWVTIWMPSILSIPLLVAILVDVYLERELKKAKQKYDEVVAEIVSEIVDGH